MRKSHFAEKSRFQGGLKNGADMRSPEDALGSYTGVGEKGERPVQDADDL